MSSYVPTPHAGAAPAHLSPPPTADPKPYLGSSGLGLPARRWTRCRFAVPPLPQPLPPGTPASGGAVPDSPGSVRVRTATAPPLRTRRRRGWRRWRGGRVRWRYWRPQHLVWSLGGGPMTLWPFQPLLHAPIVYHPPGGGPSPCFPRGGRGAGPGLAAGPASPPLRATLGRRLCISRVASSFTRSLSIRSRTARISKAPSCVRTTGPPTPQTRLFTQQAYMPSSPAPPTVSVLEQCR